MTAQGKKLTFNSEMIKGIGRENPTFRQILGMCPALAVTNSAMNGLIMGVATTFVLVCSSYLISLLRKFIPRQVRISTYIIIIATFVTVVDFTLQAIAPAAHKSMAAFIALIVVNCIILGRAEAFAAHNPVLPSTGDAVGNGLGFTGALLILGTIREILGNGSLFGVSLFGPKYEPWVIMILPPGGFLCLGVLLYVIAVVIERRQKLAAKLVQEAA
jgi:electron transport complex protein RnfE